MNIRILACTFFTVWLITSSAYSAAEDLTSRLWSYGVALSYMKLEHYPGSKDFSYVVAPIPTFFYRGQTSRIDDQDGPRAYLLKGTEWNLDLSGGLQPGQNYAEDSARAGMPSLPWMIEVGPQIVRVLNDEFQLRLGVFQVTATDFTRSSLNGQYYDLRLVYQDTQEIHGWFEGTRSDYLAFSLQGASAEFMATYYEVSQPFVTPSRPLYHAKPGLLNDELEIYQVFNKDLISVYWGAYLDNYDVSVNRQSPLQQSDHNFTFFVAVGYTLGKSQKKSIPEDETKGLINRQFLIKDNDHH